MTASETESMRLDKWLWAARFFRTRNECARIIASGHLRLDGEPVTKPHRRVRRGDVLTFAKGHDVLVVRVIALSERRLPSAEAVNLYEGVPRGGSPRGGLS